jgi:serine/threonine-protein kinase HipA
MSDELIALLDGREIGRLHRRTGGRLSFTYQDDWRETSGAYPVSLSMPLAAREHGHGVVDPFLWGLLPDNEAVIKRWATKFQVSARNAFALITHVGEDCAGAIQFIAPDRLAAVQSGEEDAVEWLDEAAIAERLRALREDHAAWRLPRDTGQFSLAGAQPKTALLLEGDRWGIPSGRIPTTHILKPPTGHFDGHAENEHFCLGLARALGLPTATSRVIQFGDEIAIVVERYDRKQANARVKRVHQEDMCQALCVSPVAKDQNEGGPGIAAIVELLRTHSSARIEDVLTFMDAIAFNWLIAGTDAHAKNYSVLIGAGPYIRLAPLYDVASILPYDDSKLNKIKLSMKVGDEYGLPKIGLRQWEKQSRDLRLDPNVVVGRLRTMVERLPDEVAAARQRAHDDGLDLPIIDRLAECLVSRAAACSRLLG